MRRVPGYLGLLLVLAACGLGGGPLGGSGSDADWVDLRAADVIGVWHGDRGDSIEFTADGLFFGTDLNYVLAEAAEARDLTLTGPAVPVSGGWSTTAATGGTKKAFVTLAFDVVGGRPVMFSLSALLAHKAGGGVQLSYRHGDASHYEEIEYRRCAEACATVAPSSKPLGTPIAPASDKLAGTWRDQHGARLVLAADGSYTADDLRFAYVGAQRLLPYSVKDLSRPLPSEGTWSLRAPPHDPGGPQVAVALAIKVVAGKPSFGTRYLLVYLDGDNLVLVNGTSNPDVVEQHVFRRAEP